MNIKKSINVALEKDEAIVQVNENDEVVGFMPRKDRRFLNKFYRVVSIWVLNSKGEVLIAQRAVNKSNNPSKWGQSVAGVVTSDELDYEIAASRETEEELGLKDFKLFKGPYIEVEGTHNAFIQFFYTFKDLSLTDLKLQEEEVQDAKWVTLKELKNDVEQNPEKYVGRMKEWITYLEQRNDYL